jgi:hypothetical protein
MATADLTAAPRAASRSNVRKLRPVVSWPSIVEAEQEGLARLLSILKRLDKTEAVSLLDRVGTPALERRLLLTMHNLIHASTEDRDAERLADSWLKAAPALLGEQSLTPLQHQLVRWADSAAESWLRTS